MFYKQEGVGDKALLCLYAQLLSGYLSPYLQGGRGKVKPCISLQGGRGKVKPSLQGGRGKVKPVSVCTASKGLSLQGEGEGIFYKGAQFPLPLHRTNQSHTYQCPNSSKLSYKATPTTHFYSRWECLRYESEIAAETPAILPGFWIAWPRPLSHWPLG